MPKIPKIKCQNGPTNTFRISSPLGLLSVVSCPRGIHSLDLPEGEKGDTFTPDLSTPVSMVSRLFQDNGYTYKPALQCVEWLSLYFSGSKSVETLPLPPICPMSLPYSVGSFTQQVWLTLKDQINFGETVSYSGLAKLCDNPRAQQAVGTAMRNNPISIIVPCHRVILNSGKPGNYSGGKRNSMKVWLLEYEKCVRRRY